MGIQVSEKCRGIRPSATLRLNALVAEKRAQGQDVISMAAGEPDMDTPEVIKKAAEEALRAGKTKYTATAGILPLRKAIAGTLRERQGLNYDPAQVMVTSGAKQALTNAFAAVLNPGDEVLLPAPCWLSYPELIRMADGVPVAVETGAGTGYVPGPAQLRAKLSGKTRAVLLNSPNNPTGAVYSREQLAQIADFAGEHDLAVISDEIYEDFVYEGARHVSIASLSEDARERTIIVNGFSKAFAKTGWRLGYAAGPRQMIAAMDAFQSHAAGNPNSLAQYAALAGLQESGVAGGIVSAFAARRERMLKGLQGIPDIRFFRPRGAFYVLLDVSGLTGKAFRGQNIADDLAFAEMLLEHQGVSVVPGSPFLAPGCCRLSYAASEERIDEAMRRIAAFVSEIA